MRIIDDVRQTTEHFPHVVLTVGSFDGVHLGHQRIIERLVEAAKCHQGTPALMTLRPHPRHFFTPEHAPNLLTSIDMKEELLDATGVEVLYVLPFNAEVARMTPEAFLEDIVVGRCGAKQLIVGHDFAFGRNAAGNYAFLEAQAPKYGIEVYQEPPLVIQGERVSSTLIRERVLQGDLEAIEVLLGRKHALRGRVEPGRGIGQKLGFPTANILPHGGVIPAHGVYAAEVCVEGTHHPAAVNIGVAPTIAHDNVVVEAHILDYDHQLAGTSIDVIFHKRLRPEKKFPSYEALIEAIAKDVADIRAYFDNPAR